jgi:hypothetical protein
VPGDFIDFELVMSGARRGNPYQLRAFRSAIEAEFGPILPTVSLQDAFKAVRASIEQAAHRKIMALEGAVDEPVPILGLDMQL